MKKRILILTLIIILINIFFLFIYNPINSISDISTNPEISILDSNNNEIIHLINNHKTTPIKPEKIHSKNIKMLLEIEDKSFYKHSGFNLTRIFKTIISNVSNKKSAGASTITQQYIKNVYLDNSKTLIRKIKEIYYAIKLEQVATKDEILASYLNCVYLGNDIYGLVDGAKYYFNKDYSNLSIKEMAVFIALINAPTYYSQNLDKLEIKKNNILKTLYKNNIINNEEYNQAITPTTFNYNKEIYNSNLLYFVDSTLKEFNSYNINARFNQKITISTRYNSNMNKLKKTTDANYASIAVDKEGYITSIIGDKNYYESSFNIVEKGNRDIGSTIKPILYYEALKCNFKPSLTYYSSPYSFKYNNETITINNYGSIYPYSYIDMRYAIATSDNIYAIKTHQTLGFKTLANHLKKYGINANPLPSLALGSVGMSLYDLVRIYTQFFKEGKYLNLKYIEQISIDNTKKYKSNESYQILGNTNYFKAIKELMSSVFDESIPHATCKSIANKLNSKCYGKSGLTDYDSYMIGFNDEILVGVWTGYLDNKELTDSNTKKLAKEIFVDLINAY